MLLSVQSNRYAHQLLTARAESRQVPLLSDEASLSITDAYDIAKHIRDIRIANGEIPIGRKIEFMSAPMLMPPEQETEQSKPISTLIWSSLFDTTVRYASNNQGTQSLVGAVQPRLQPQIIFKLNDAPPAGVTVEEIADYIEWMAHGIEVVACPFADWNYTDIDAIAAFGLHGTLIIGEQTTLSAASRRNLASILAMTSVSVSCATADTVSLRGAGFGSAISDSPVHALWELHQLLQRQNQFGPLEAGEIIATGAWTVPYPVEAGQTWTTAFSGITLPGLTISFV